jgi:hypothetical protein
MLTASPCNVRSEVSLRDFREFVSAIEGDALAIKKDNFKGLSQPCDEFGFQDLAERFRSFASPRISRKREHRKIRKRGRAEGRKRRSISQRLKGKCSSVIRRLQCCGANCRGKRKHMNWRWTCFLDDLRGLRRNYKGSAQPKKQ